MKKPILTPILGCIFFISFMGCESGDDIDPINLIDQVGFVGTLPDGRPFGDTGIKYAHGTGLSSMGTSAGGSSYVYHGFHVRDEVSGIDIYVQLPEVKFKDDYEISGLDTKEIAAEYYPYAMVKEKLSLGTKNLPFQQEATWENNFYVSVLNQINYNGYVLTPGLIEEGNYLKVLQLIEGVEENLQGDEVRMMEVIFELDIKLTAIEPASGPPSGNLKGQLRMKYREDLSMNSFEF